MNTWFSSIILHRHQNMMFRYLISPRFGGVKAFGGNLVSTTSQDFALLKTPFNQKCLHKSTIVVRQMSIKSKQQQHQNTTSPQPSLATFPSNENKKGFYSGKSFTDWRVGLLTRAFRHPNPVLCKSSDRQQPPRRVAFQEICSHSILCLWEWCCTRMRPAYNLAAANAEAPLPSAFLYL